MTRPVQPADTTQEWFQATAWRQEGARRITVHRASFETYTKAAAAARLWQRESKQDLILTIRKRFVSAPEPNDQRTTKGNQK